MREQASECELSESECKSASEWGSEGEIERVSTRVEGKRSVSE